MSALTIRCLRAGLLCLVLGVLLGASFAIDRALGARLRPLHAELNLWGWVTLLIYGVGYHMLPRFAGRRLPHPQLADVQSWLAIGGVALAALGWTAAAFAQPGATIAMIAGGSAQLAAAALFCWLMRPLLVGSRA